MTETLVSIIVPVYNTQEYLTRCIDSILAQTYRHLEIILVDDGSTDDSGLLCDNLARQDTRVKVIHQANKGVSVARNTGIAAATGRYIQFCDSDDRVECNITERLLQGMLEYGADIALCGIKVHCAKGKERDYNFLGTRDGICETALFWREFAKSFHVFFGANCNKLYKADVIKKESICFITDASFAEDFAFNVEYFKSVSCVYVVGEALYHYNQTVPNSLAKQFIPLGDFFCNEMRIYHAVEALYHEKHIYETNQQELHYLLLFMLDLAFLRQPEACLKRDKTQVYALCSLPEIQNAAKDAAAYKMTIRILRYALQHHQYYLIFWVRRARAIFGIT
ncbi:MAG: glycosyltransferase [Ruthenibacterium sp.]